jgi:DNA-binding transcriptional ArsR family regulator
MTSDSAVFKPRPDVRFRVVGDEAVIVRQQDAEVIALNEVGASVLALLDSRRSVRDVLDALLEQYDVDRASLSSDLARFLSELRDAGVVEES